MTVISSLIAFVRYQIQQIYLKFVISLGWKGNCNKSVQQLRGTDRETVYGGYSKRACLLFVSAKIDGLANFLGQTKF
jgi:hypothetical protein